MTTDIDWDKAAKLLAALEEIGRHGAVVVIKMDGERDFDKFTVIVSGVGQGVNAFRQDGDNFTELLESALEFYRDHSGEVDTGVGVE